MTAPARDERSCRERTHLAHGITDNTKRSGARPPSADSDGGESLTVRLPSGLANGPGLTYALEALLKPLGLALNVVPAADPATIELTWPGRGARGVPVNAGRLEAAFAALSGQRELDAPRDRLGRAMLPDKPPDDIQLPAFSLWAREMAATLAAANPAWRPPEPALTVYLTHDIDRVHPLEPMGLAGKAARAMKGWLCLAAEPGRELVRWVRHAGDFFGTFLASL